MITVKKHIILIVLIIMAFCACKQKSPIPESGRWICKELEAEIVFRRPGEEAASSEVQYKSEKVKCYMMSDYGSDWIWLCSESDVPGICKKGDVVFRGRVIEFDDAMLLFEFEGEEYCFYQSSP